MTEQNNQLELLNNLLERIFSLPISQMTLRELQNAINEAFQGNELKNDIFESLLQGRVQDSIKGKFGKDFDKLVADYRIKFKLAKEIAETGDFMNSFICDLMQQNKKVYFVNRLRRIDGHEYHFNSLAETNVRLAHMFINRLSDLKKAVDNKVVGPIFQIDPKLRLELEALKKDIEGLLS